MNVITAISCAAIETKLCQEAYLMMLRGLPHDASRVDVLGIEKKWSPAVVQVTMMTCRNGADKLEYTNTCRKIPVTGMVATCA